MYRKKMSIWNWWTESWSICWTPSGTRSSNFAFTANFSSFASTSSCRWSVSPFDPAQQQHRPYPILRSRPPNCPQFPQKWIHPSTIPISPSSLTKFFPPLSSRKGILGIWRERVSTSWSSISWRTWHPLWAICSGHTETRSNCLTVLTKRPSTRLETTLNRSTRLSSG